MTPNIIEAGGCHVKMGQTIKQDTYTFEGHAF